MGWLILFQMIWISIRIHVSFKAPPPNDLLPWSQPVHFAGERNCLQQKIVLNHVAKFHYRYHFHVVLNNARKKIFLSLRKKQTKSCPNCVQGEGGQFPKARVWFSGKSSLRLKLQLHYRVCPARSQSTADFTFCELLWIRIDIKYRTPSSITS